MGRQSTKAGSVPGTLIWESIGCYVLSGSCWDQRAVGDVGFEFSVSCGMLLRGCPFVVIMHHLFVYHFLPHTHTSQCPAHVASRWLAGGITITQMNKNLNDQDWELKSYRTGCEAVAWIAFGFSCIMILAILSVRG